MKVVGWIISALLLFSTPRICAEYTPEALYSEYENLSYEKLLQELNATIEFHDNLRAKIVSTLTGSTLQEFIEGDNWWCKGRESEFEKAVKTRNSQVLIRIIILENLRNGVLLEKIP